MPEKVKGLGIENVFWNITSLTKKEILSEEIDFCAYCFLDDGTL